jgi:hypothetical protein
MNKKSKKRFFNKRNKTFKKKSDSSCDNFCKNDYSPEIEKKLKKIAKENKLPYKPTKDVRDYRIIDCKQKFCNEGCKGYIFLSKEVEKKFKKNINGNFLKKTKPRIIQKLKSKGAISYCDNDDYNPFHQ